MLSRLNPTNQLRLKYSGKIFSLQIATMFLADPCAELIANLSGTNECSIVTRNTIALLFVAGDFLLTGKMLIDGTNAIHWSKPRPRLQQQFFRPPPRAAETTPQPSCTHYVN